MAGARRAVLSRSVWHDVLSEAQRAAPQECCGLLVGKNEGGKVVILRHLPSPNRAADPRTAFEIDPAVTAHAQRLAREAGYAVVGCYHSHPGGAPEPSGRDRERARDLDLVWLIAGERDGRPHMGAFAARVLTPLPLGLIPD